MSGPDRKRSHRSAFTSATYATGPGGATRPWPASPSSGGTCGARSTWHADQVTEQPPPQGRLARLYRYADVRHIPLRTIVVTVAVVAATYLAGKLIYRLRDVVLLVVVAGFVAILLNPIVVYLQKRVPSPARPGGDCRHPLDAGALRRPGLRVRRPAGERDHAPGRPAADVRPNAESGTGWIGHLVRKYHIQRWVQQNSPKLVNFAQSLSQPALTVGKGAVSLVIELATIFVLVLLLLLEGPKMRRGILSQLPRPRAQHHPDSRAR